MEAKAIQDLLYIAVVSRPVISSLVSQGWLQDGIDDEEAGAIDWINNIGSAEVASSVVSLGWIRDGIDAVEVKAIRELSYIAYEDAGVASSVVSLGWVQDGIDDTEVEAINWIGNIGAVEVASSVVSLDWVQDGIEASEVNTIEELSYIANRETKVGLSLVSLDWLQDGVDDAEVEAINWIGNIGAVEVASSVVSLDWVQDGIEASEVNTIEELSYIANRDAGAALRIVRMPFLESIEAPDLSALESLRQLVAFQTEAFDRVMSSPAVGDGITDELAPIVATLKGVAATNSDLIDVLLDPNRVSLEERAITLPLSGDVILDSLVTRAFRVGSAA